MARDWLLHWRDVELRILQMIIATLESDALSAPELLDDIPTLLETANTLGGVLPNGGVLVRETSAPDA